MGTDARRAELLELLLEHSFEKRKVVLASGKESDFYLDARRTLMLPRGVALAGALMLERLQAGAAVDAVGGMAVGAVPLVSAVLAAAAGDPRSEALRGFFVRKEVKQHGTGRRIEGQFEPGVPLALLEDTCTTGGSTLDAVEAVESEGGKVVRVLCIVDRGEGASEAFAARGLTLESLFTRSDLPL